MMYVLPCGSGVGGLPGGRNGKKGSTEVKDVAKRVKPGMPVSKMEARVA